MTITARVSGERLGNRRPGVSVLSHWRHAQPYYSHLVEVRRSWGLVRQYLPSQGLGRIAYTLVGGVVWRFVLSNPFRFPLGGSGIRDGVRGYRSLTQSRDSRTG